MGERSAADEVSAREPAQLVYPAVGTVMVTAAVLSLVCHTPAEPFRSVWGLLGWSVGWLLLALVAHLLTIRGIAAAYRETLDAPVALLSWGMWPCVALLPAGMLLTKAGAEAAMAVLPAMAVLAVRFVRREAPGAGRRAHEAEPASVAEELFAWTEPPGLLRVLWSSVLAAVLLVGAAAMALSWQFGLAGLLAGLALMICLWRMPMQLGPPTRTPGIAERRRLWWETVAALLVTAVVLLPRLGGRARGSPMMALLRGRSAEAVPKAEVPKRGVGGELYGVVLTLPAKPRERQVTAPTMAHDFRGGAQPAVIPFDGAYWYFRSPFTRPLPEAKRVVGDPTKVLVRSTDRMPLEMEAHQRFEPALELGCCQTIRVRVRNAEKEVGPLRVEMILTMRRGRRTWQRSLGVKTLRTSEEGGNGASRVEDLDFVMAEQGGGVELEEIGVAMRPTGDRVRVGAHVAIVQFELLRQ